MKSAIGTPPKLGLEIEANWPIYSSLPDELRNTITMEDYERFKNYAMGHCSTVRAGAPYFYRGAPAKFHFPEGWFKSSDAGCELKFDGPANNMQEAETLVDRGIKWLLDFGFNRFSGAGTHVHLGHEAWLKEVIGPATNPLHYRAENLLYGYFATREMAIFKLASPIRMSCGSCNPIFNTSYGYGLGFTGDRFGKSTPLWALHNYLITNTRPTVLNAGMQYGSNIQVFRKNLPTIEFRFFEGTNKKTAVRGYLRLLHRMFINATHVVTEENCRVKEADQNDQILVNPFTYTVDDLLKEVSDDPWLVNWIKATKKADGNPIDTDIDALVAASSSAARAPEALAAA